MLNHFFCLIKFSMFVHVPTEEELFSRDRQISALRIPSSCTHIFSAVSTNKCWIESKSADICIYPYIISATTASIIYIYILFWIIGVMFDISSFPIPICCSRSIDKYQLSCLFVSLMVQCYISLKLIAWNQRHWNFCN